MKKGMKWVVRIILGIVILWLTIFSIDFLRCLSLKKPLFLFSTIQWGLKGEDFSGQGLGYRVNYSMTSDENNAKQVTWVEFIMFGKRIMSKSLYEKEEDKLENNTRTEPYENMEGILVTTNIEN